MAVHPIRFNPESHPPAPGPRLNHEARLVMCAVEGCTNVALDNRYWSSEPLLCADCRDELAALPPAPFWSTMRHALLLALAACAVFVVGLVAFLVIVEYAK